MKDGSVYFNKEPYSSESHHLIENMPLSTPPYFI